MTNTFLRIFRDSEWKDGGGSMQRMANTIAELMAEIDTKDTRIKELWTDEDMISFADWVDWANGESLKNWIEAGKPSRSPKAPRGIVAFKIDNHISYFKTSMHEYDYWAPNLISAGYPIHIIKTNGQEYSVGMYVDQYYGEITELIFTVRWMCRISNFPDGLFDLPEPKLPE